jgi:hypothetical protein
MAFLDEIDPIHRGEESFPLLDVQRYDKLGNSVQGRAVRKKVADIPVRYDDYIFFIQQGGLRKRHGMGGARAAEILVDHENDRTI